MSATTKSQILSIQKVDMYVIKSWTIEKGSNSSQCELFQKSKYYKLNTIWKRSST
jgi:hypothetical protein